MSRKLVKRFFGALPPEDSKGAFGVAEDNTEPLAEGSFAQHQAIRPQPHHSGAETRFISPSRKGRTGQNHSSNSRPPKSSSPRYVQKSFAFSYPTAPSGSVKTFFTNMGTDYKRPLDPSSSLRLPNRTSRLSCATQNPYSYPMYTGPPNHNRSGSSGTTIKRGNPLRPTQYLSGTRICQLPICSTQKGWGTQANYKSKTPELFHTIRTLQNGVYTHVEGSSKKRGLHDKTRPKGCISDSPNLAESPEVSTVSVERFASGIRMPPLWFGQHP